MDERERQRLERQTKGDRRTIALVLGIAAGVFVAALIASVVVLVSHWSDVQTSAAVEPAATEPAATEPAPTQPGPPPAAADADLFAENCGSCHTLAAANTSGTIGPNLDDLQPDRALVLTTIQNGAGGGVMPADLLAGAEAQRVAAFVAANAGG